VKTLRTAGLEEKIAEARMEARRAHVLPQLATRRDVQDLMSELKTEIGRLRLLMERFHTEP
jgi:hypothetical protein